MTFICRARAHRSIAWASKTLESCTSRDGVSELRIDVGAGYRVYYAMAGKQVVLLLCGGDKRTQDADLHRACAHWKHWKKENGQ